MTKFPLITKFLAIVAILFAMAIFLQADNALAADAKTADLTKYNPGTYKCEMLPGQLTEALVECITTPVKNVVLKPATGNNQNEMGLLAYVSKYMGNFLKIVITLSIVMFGLKVFNVRSSPYNAGIGLVIKLGIALLLVNNFGGFAPRLYDVFNELVNIGNLGGTPIWKQIDLFLSNLFGFVSNSPSDIEKGVMALLSGSIFAKGLGITITLVGVLAIGSVIIFILQAMFLYLISFIAFSFLLAIGPIFAIFFIFGYTERFFSKWFELILSTVLTPLLMFAFLSIFLDVQAPAGGGSGPPSPGIISQAVEEVFIALGNGRRDAGKDYVRRCLKTAQPLVSAYLLPTDPNLADKLACPPPLLPDCQRRDEYNGTMQSWLNPYIAGNLNYTPYTVSTIDCGINDSKIKEEVFKKLLALFIYVAFINAMVHRIPGIATDLANGVNVGMTHLASPVMSMIDSIKR
jgi:hypothetical protein